MKVRKRKKKKKKKKKKKVEKKKASKGVYIQPRRLKKMIFWKEMFKEILKQLRAKKWFWAPEKKEKEK